MKLIITLIMALMALLTLNSALAITFYDDFGNGIIDHNWTINPDVAEQDGFLIFGSNGGSVYQNFSDTLGIDLAQAFTIKWNITNTPNINTAYSSIYLSDGEGNYVFISPDYDSADSFINDDLIIYCGGSCSCPTLINLSTPEQPAYEATITFNPLTDTLRLERNDSASLENTITGCSFKQTDIQVFGRDGDVNVSDFYLEGLPFCYPNWSCTAYAACLPNNTQQCNLVTDTNICGDSYTGDYSEFTPQACVYGLTGYNVTYDSTDLPAIVIDGIGKFGVVLVSMIVLVALVVLYGWAKGRFF